MSDVIELKDGNGGVNMQTLIAELTEGFKRAVDTGVDAVPFLTLEGEQWLTTTDGFSVDPLFFPGGSIGSLAVNGTVNDLAVSGATPKFLTLNLFLEEGLEKTTLRAAMDDFKSAAQSAGVTLIAGDTKVLPRGQVPGMLMATTGLGVRSTSKVLGLSEIRPTDVIVSSGTLGDHGASVMLAREAFGLRGDIQSCCASVLPFTQSALNFEGLRFMRDPTRGGLTTVLYDIYSHTHLNPSVVEAWLPIRAEVKAMCAMLGYDPLVLASEGRVIAVIAAHQASELVQKWQLLPNGEHATIIGTVSDRQDAPILVTALGGEKYIRPLNDDPLPRIC